MGYWYKVACPILSICGEGSAYPRVELRSALFIIVFLTIFFGIYFFVKKVYWEKILSTQQDLNSRLKEYNVVNALLRCITGHEYDVFQFKGLEPKKDVSTVGFSDLGLVLPNGSRVLKGVTGEFKNSSLNAIMGPSGSGKSVSILFLFFFNMWLK